MLDGPHTVKITSMIQNPTTGMQAKERLTLTEVTFIIPIKFLNSNQCYRIHFSTFPFLNKPKPQNKVSASCGHLSLTYYIIHQQTLQVSLNRNIKTDFTKATSRHMTYWKRTKLTKEPEITPSQQ